ncbi:MAG: twin-arginine translocase subunit TatC [Flavobacteriales bacterium]
MEEDKEMNFLDHVEVLRKHLFRIIFALLLCSIFAFVFRDWLFTEVILASSHSDFATFKALCWLSHTLGLDESLCIEDQNLKLQSIQMAGQFTTSMWASFIIGFIVSFPYILWELWKFILPGLKTTEQKYSKWIIVLATLTFFIGVLFGYYVIIPLAVNFFGTFQVSNLVENIVSLNSYVSMVSNLALSCGLMFELPIIVYFLAKLGIITPEGMRKYRKHAFVATLVFAAIITPPDFLSQVLVALPVWLLYELGILIAKRTLKNA